MKPGRNYLWLLLALAVMGFCSGCASTGSESMAERPWNAPMNWEYGLPPSMMEGR